MNTSSCDVSLNFLGEGRVRFWTPSKTFLRVRHAFLPDLPNKRLLNYEEPLPFFGCLLLFKETNQHWLIVTTCRLVLSILYFLCETSTLHLDSCPLGARDMAFEFMSGLLKKQSVLEFYGRASLFVAPYWRAPQKAKQLSTATTPLCFWFFRCRVDVLQS